MLLFAIHALVYGLVGALALIQIGVFLIPARYYSSKVAEIVWDLSFIHLSLELKSRLYGFAFIIAIALEMMKHTDLSLAALCVAAIDMVVLVLTTHSFGQHKLAAIYKRCPHYNPNALTPQPPLKCTMIARQIIETAYWDKTAKTIAVQEERRRTPQ